MSIDNLRQAHRHGEAWKQEPKLKDANWWVISALLALVGFWCWVGYQISQWWP